MYVCSLNISTKILLPVGIYRLFSCLYSSLLEFMNTCKPYFTACVYVVDFVAMIQNTFISLQYEVTYLLILFLSEKNYHVQLIILNFSFLFL